MELSDIFFNLLNKPDVPRFYRELRDYYASIHKFNEAAAFDHLVEKRFGKNNGKATDDSSCNPEPQEHYRADP